MHGTDILNTGKQVYSKKFKEQAIEQAIFGTKSYVQLSLELGFKSKRRSVFIFEFSKIIILEAIKINCFFFYAIFYK